MRLTKMIGLRRDRPSFLLLLSLLLTATVMAAAKEEELAVNPRIIGGQPSDPKDYPFFVRLSINSFSPAGEFHCGGTLIHPEWVLTAAHCDRTRLVAYVGPENNDTAVEITEQHYRHPQHDKKTQHYDVMLLRLAKPVLDVPTVKLNTDPDLPIAGREVVAIGKGTTDAKTFSPSETLLQTTLMTESHEQCSAIYGDMGFSILQESMLCAMGTDGDTCSGDSGGPLLDASTGVQYGITSWGYECNLPGVPGVYARVSAVQEWMQSIVCEHSVYVRSSSMCRRYRRQHVPSVTQLRLDRERDYGFRPKKAARQEHYLRCQGDRCKKRCVDDTKEFFLNKVFGIRNCEWLSQQSFGRDRLCVPGQDAYSICRKTCKSCDRN